MGRQVASHRLPCRSVGAGKGRARNKSGSTPPSGLGVAPQAAERDGIFEVSSLRKLRLESCDGGGGQEGKSPGTSRAPVRLSQGLVEAVPGTPRSGESECAGWHSCEVGWPCGAAVGLRHPKWGAVRAAEWKSRAN